MWVELKIPVPPKLAELCGYAGGARYVGLCWQPCGDECELDDGRTSGTGYWGPPMRLGAPAEITHLTLRAPR